MTATPSQSAARTTDRLPPTAQQRAKQAGEHARDAVSQARGAELHLAGVAKSFGARQVLRDVSLRVAPGEFVAFVGRSGCGKSTLLRLIAGLERPDAGSVRCGTGELRGINDQARMMFQDARLLPWLSVAQTVAVGQGGRMTPAVSAALEQVGLGDRSEDWPAVLSGGQRQRVALARALVSSPPLLLLDEPLGALDALTRIEMQTLIADIWQRRACTAILVTHDIEEAVLLADRVILLEAGRLQSEFVIDLPRPRDRTSHEAQTYVRAVLDRVLASGGDVAVG
jgi:sulfonate transport system ATP-binding protein